MFLKDLLNGLTNQVINLNIKIKQIKRLEEDVEKNCDHTLYIDYKNQCLIYQKLKDQLIYLNDFYSDLVKVFKRFYSFHEIKKIAVTGTSGKTTVTKYLYDTLKQNYNVSLICSNGVYIYSNGKEKYIKTKNTTPSMDVIYEGLYCDTLTSFGIVEVSSEGLDGNRLYGVEFDVIVFLNLYPEHLNHHKTMENYMLSKRKLLNYLKEDGIVICNKDFVDVFKLNDVITFDVNNISYLEENINYSVVKIDNKFIKTNIHGLFGLYNISALKTILTSLNIELALMEQYLVHNPFVKGRFELIMYNDVNYIIDFAHTINEVDAILACLKSYCSNRLITVIGCGGKKDKIKRNEIGKLCIKYSDLTIFTEDNSRDEDVNEIINDMTYGLDESKYKIIITRPFAISYAVDSAKKNDIVAILGKGAEEEIISHKIIKFNDLKFLKQYLRILK